MNFQTIITVVGEKEFKYDARPSNSNNKVVKKRWFQILRCDFIVKKQHGKVRKCVFGRIFLNGKF